MEYARDVDANRPQFEGRLKPACREPRDVLGGEVELAQDAPPDVAEGCIENLAAERFRLLENRGSRARSHRSPS